MSAKEQSIGIWKSLPPMVKGVVILGSLVGAYLIYKKVSKNYKSNEDVKEVGGELQDAISQGVQPTLTPSQITTIADGLYESMDGWSLGADTYIGEFKSYFYKIKNKADLFAVMKKFGVKEDYDLKGWIQTEGTVFDNVTKEKTTPKEVANRHLKSQGIDYRF